MRSRIVLLVLILAGVFVCAAPVLAAEPAGGHGETGDSGVFGFFVDLFIWTIVVFMILLFVLTKYAWKPMLEGLQKREDNIRSAIDDAEKAKAEAQKLREELRIEMGKAHDKAREIVEEAHRNGQKLADEIMVKTKADIQVERERLLREIKLAQDDAMQELWNRSATLATEISTRAIQRDLSGDDHRRLVDEALVALKGATQSLRS